MTKTTTRDRERVRLCRQIWNMRADGDSDRDIQRELKLSPIQYSNLTQEMFEIEAARIRETPIEQVFLEYSLIQLSCIAEAERAVHNLKDNEKGTTALVAAIRAKSDIYDKIMKFGQDVGLIDKKPQEQRIIKGVVLTSLSDDDLRLAIAEQAMRLQGIVKEYGGMSIVDMDPGELHYVAPTAVEGPIEELARSVATATNRAKTSRVHKSRRVVKEHLQ